MFTHPRKILSLLVCAAIVFLSSLPVYAREATDVQLTVQALTEQLYLLQDSAGSGNSIVFIGDEGVLLVDTKATTMCDKLFEKIEALSEKPIRFAVITHWHFDHVGGNETIANTGTPLIAHANVRKQMGVGHDMKIFDKTVPPSPEAARPIVTFEKEMAIHLNGETIRVFHLGAGHTDGDGVVFFQNANVIHMGDLFFQGIYPYIGIYSGGTINGMITNIKQILTMINENTKVVPGHGPLSTKAELQNYVSMLTTVRDKVSRLIEKGRKIEEVVAEKPTQAFDETWGKGFLPPDQFARLVYMDLSPEMP